MLDRRRLGIEGRAIVEADAFAQRELDGAVVNQLPGGRQQRHHLARGEIARDQLLNDVQEARPAGFGEAAPRIHADRLDADSDDEGAVLRLQRARCGQQQQE